MRNFREIYSTGCSDLRNVKQNRVTAREGALRLTSFQGVNGSNQTFLSLPKTLRHFWASDLPFLWDSSFG